MKAILTVILGTLGLALILAGVVNLSHAFFKVMIP